MSNSEEDFTTKLSLVLTSILNLVGVSEFMRGLRRHYAKQEEWLYLLLYREENVPCFVLGSRIEGTTTPGMESDTDIMECYQEPKIVQSYEDADFTKHLNAIMFSDDDTHPGYVKLEFCLPMPEMRTMFMNCLRDMPIYEHLTIDYRNRILICNSYGRRTETCDQLSGPARTVVFSTEYYSVSLDRVFSYQCHKWPSQALPWLQRKRRWPSEASIELIKKRGCFVTPVGHPFSLQPNLEWRLSFSLSERYLIWSFNEIQFKCLVLMKLIVKTFIKPIFEDAITTYHCKMCLFSVIEETEQTFWNSNYILLCLQKCIIRLLQYIDAGNIPQYFIPDNNLLEHKMTNSQRNSVSKILRELLNSNFRFLLEIRNDDIGSLLYQTFSQFDYLPLKTASEVTERNYKLMCTLPLPSLGLLTYWKNKLLWNMRGHGDLLDEIKYHFKILKQLLRSVSDFKNRDCFEQPRKMMEIMIPHLAHSLGYHLIVFGLRITRSESYAKEIIHMGLTLVGTGMHLSEISNLLRLAALLYKCHLLREMETVLSHAHHLYSEDIFPVCKCNDRMIQLFESDMEHIFTSNFNRIVTKFASNCTIYLQSELDIAPPAMVYEMFRSCGCAELSDWRGKWSDTGVCDALTYMHYLTFICYNELWDTSKADEAIKNLEEAIIKEPNLGHVETAYNLLGHCFVLKEDFNSAVGYFKRSLLVHIEEDNRRYTLHDQHLHNAAKWHIALLSFQTLNRLGIV